MHDHSAPESNTNPESFLPAAPTPIERKDLFTQRRLDHRRDAKAYGFTLSFRGVPSPAEEAVLKKLSGLTVLDLEADQCLCAELVALRPFIIECGCKADKKAHITLRCNKAGPKAPGAQGPSGTAASKYILPVGCTLSSLHDASCLFFGLTAPGKPALVTDGAGIDTITVNAALRGGPDHAGDDEVSFAVISDRPACMRDPVQGKWALHTLLVYAYEKALLHHWPRKGPAGFKNDFIDLFLALGRIHIGNNNRPYAAAHYGSVSLIPELFRNTESMMRRKIKERERPIIIGRYVSHRLSEDGTTVSVQVLGMEDVKFVVAASIWNDRMESFHDPEEYRKEGFFTLLVFSAAAAKARHGDAICMKNLAWLHVTEHNIPIESQEEGWEIRKFIAQRFRIEKVLEKLRDGETGQELARRDLRIFGTIFGDIEVEIFGMSLIGYVKKIPSRMIETGRPLLCIHYQGGKMTKRHWADPKREKNFPEGQFPKSILPLGNLNALDPIDLRTASSTPCP